MPGGGWGDAEAYERFVVRWSRPAARAFLRWFEPAPGLRWLDVGCGTGELSRAIVATAAPSIVMGVDQSEAHIEHASQQSSNIEYRSGDAQSLPFEDDSFDAVVSGLVLNFVPDPAQAIAEKMRVARPTGIVGGYVWDYTGGMQLGDYSLVAARSVDASVRAAEVVGSTTFDPPSVISALENAGAVKIEDGSIEVETTFRDFDEVWSPMLGGQGPIGEYLRSHMPVAADGSITLTARAWTAKGKKDK